jgi:hypothetical protein
MVAESSSTQIYSETVKATEQQVPAPKAHTERGVSEHVAVTSDESTIETPSIPVTDVQPSSASEETVKRDLWTIADEIWDLFRQAEAEAEASRKHNRLFGESSVGSVAKLQFLREIGIIVGVHWRMGKVQEIFVNRRCP